MELLSKSNSKLRKDGIVSFGLPAGKTCPFAGECRSFCYAAKGCYRFSSIEKAQNKRFLVTRTKQFVQAMSDECQPGGIVRIHDSGDFYSKAYLDKWVEIATHNPYTYFYAYTKSVQYFLGRTMPKNFRVIFSFGGKDDHMIDTRRDYHAVIFKDKAALDAAGYADSSESDLVAARGRIRRIGLIAH